MGLYGLEAFINGGGSLDNLAVVIFGFRELGSGYCWGFFFIDLWSIYMWGI